MSKSIKLSEEVYEKLREFQGKRESFSEAVDRLLTILEKVGELRDVLEGQIAYYNYKREQLGAVGTGINGKPLISRPHQQEGANAETAAH